MSSEDLIKYPLCKTVVDLKKLERCLSTHESQTLISDDLIVIYFCTSSDEEEDYENYYQEHYKHLLFIFNRYTRSWLQLSWLDNACVAYYPFELIGFVRPRVFAGLCQSKENTFDTTVHGIGVEIQLFGITKDVDHMIALRHITIAERYDDMPSVVGIVQTAPDRLLFVFGECWVRRDGEPKGTIVFENYGASDAVVERARFEDDPPCEYAMMHDGELFLLCHKRGATEYAIYLVDGNRKQLIANRQVNEFAAARAMSCDNRLIIATCRKDRYQFETAIFDVATRQWTNGCITLPTGGISYRYLPAKNSALSDVLVRASYTDSRGVKQEGFGTVWLLPPKLRTIALDAVHHHMPDDTVHKLSAAKGIFGTVDLVKFLLNG